MSRQVGYVVVMGVSGSGKTEIVRSVANATNALWLDADDHHPIQNVEHMRRGQPLNDDMRWPWLDAVADAAHQKAATRANGHNGQGTDTVFIACSALKRSYRDFLSRKLDPVTFVYLDGTREVILTRLENRVGHFMPSTLLDSQLADLEPPGPDENCVSVSIDAPIDVVASTVAARLAAKGNHVSSITKDKTAGQPAFQGEDK